MENTMINSEALEVKPTGLDMESIPAMAESLGSEEDILDEISENSEPIETEEDNRIMITQEMMDEELAKMESLNFLELMAMEKDLKSRKNSMENAKVTVEQLLNTKAELRKTLAEKNEKESLGDKLAIADAEAKAGIESDENEEDIKTFLDNYDISIGRLDETIEKVQAKIKEFDDIPKTTTYMNKAMTEIVDKRIKEIEDFEKENEGMLNTRYKNLKKYYYNIKDLYQNRDNVDRIIDRINANKSMLKAFVNRINRETKQNKDNSTVGAQISATKAFCQMFSIEQMQAFDKYLKSVFNPDDSDKDVSVFMTQYMLYIVYTHPKAKKLGDHKRVEMLIMNVLDIINGTYDLPNGIDYFNEQLLKIKTAVLKDMPKVRQ